MLFEVRDYAATELMGEGGMGAVYLAEDVGLGHPVALKVLHPRLTTDTHFVERFRQEARVQSLLVHPRIVSLHAFFEEAGQYYMVMEFVRGRTLKRIIEEEGAIPENRALNVFRQMLDAVAFAHSKQIIHRDIKPSNVMLNAGDEVKILDFGIAKMIGGKGLTVTGTKVGTLYYMSPEQVRARKDIDRRTDIYSLGVTLYEWCPAGSRSMCTRKATSRSWRQSSGPRCQIRGI